MPNRGGFSWKRAVGISAAKSRVSRRIGIPLTKSGRQRKIGRVVTGGGCLLSVFAAASLVVVLGCGGAVMTSPPGTGTIIDSFPLGQPVASDPSVEAVARQVLDQHYPGHAAVTSVAAYVEDLTNDSIYHGQVVGRSGVFLIYVFALADGTYHATGVHSRVGGLDGYSTYPH